MIRRVIILTIALLAPVVFSTFTFADAPPQTRPSARSQPFLNDIMAFEKADREHAPPTQANLFVGSSTFRIWKTLADDFPKAKVINRGFGGSQTSDILNYMQQIVLPCRPKRIFYYAGDNDLAAGKTPDEVFKNFKAFARRVHSSLPDTDLVFISIKPSPSRAKLLSKMKETNELIEAYAKEEVFIEYIDVFTPMLGPDGQPRPELFGPDMLHMNRKGYELWIKVLTPMVD
jgi:lysophospholipase L1-like esterase